MWPREAARSCANLLPGLPYLFLKPIWQLWHFSWSKCFDANKSFIWFQLSYAQDLTSKQIWPRIFFLKFGNPVGIKIICEFTLNWYLRAALAKNSGTLCVNSAIAEVCITIRKLVSGFRSEVSAKGIIERRLSITATSCTSQTSRGQKCSTRREPGREQRGK